MTASPSVWRRRAPDLAGRLGYLLLGGAWLWSSFVVAPRVALAGLAAALIALLGFRLRRRITWSNAWLALVAAGTLGGALASLLQGTELRPPGPTPWADFLHMLNIVAGDALGTGAFLVGGGLSCLVAAIRPKTPAPETVSPMAAAGPAPQTRASRAIRTLRRAGLVLVLGFGILWLVMGGPFAAAEFNYHGPVGAARRTMRSALRNLATLQGDYFAENRTFATDLSAFSGFDWTPQRVRVVVERADKTGWRARADHEWVTTFCTIAGEASRANEGQPPEPPCQEDRHWFRSSYDTPLTPVVRPRDYVLLPGDTLRLDSWTVRQNDPWSKVPAPLDWESSNSAVAAVDSRGMARAVATGTAAVRARARGPRGAAVDSAVLTVAASFAPVRTLSVGERACALTADGVAHCWRADVEGSTRPAPVSGAQRFTSISAGSYHACGITKSGAVYCWGSSAYGGLGNGETGRATRAEPVPVGGRLRAKVVVGGLAHTCALDLTGRAYCWGSNDSYQLGRDLPGDAESSATPAPVETSLRFTTLALGGAFTCGLDPAGVVYCWGSDTRGELGGASASDPCPHVGNPECTSHPVRVAGAPRFRTITANSHICGLTPDGQAYCWAEQWRHVGQPAARYAPHPVAGPQRFVALTAGFNHTCGLASDGTAYCWGENWRGQLGDGSRQDRSAPVAVTGGLRFARLAAGGPTCGLSTSGRIYCWGYDVYGRSRDPRYFDDRPAPVAGPVVGR